MGLFTRQTEDTSKVICGLSADNKRLNRLLCRKQQETEDIIFQKDKELQTAIAEKERKFREIIWLKNKKFKHLEAQRKHFLLENKQQEEAINLLQKNYITIAENERKKQVLGYEALKSFTESIKLFDMKSSDVYLNVFAAIAHAVKFWFLLVAGIYVLAIGTNKYINSQMSLSYKEYSCLAVYGILTFYAIHDICVKIWKERKAEKNLLRTAVYAAVNVSGEEEEKVVHNDMVLGRGSPLGWLLFLVCNISISVGLFYYQSHAHTFLVSEKHNIISSISLSVLSIAFSLGVSLPFLLVLRAIAAAKENQWTKLINSNYLRMRKAHKNTFDELQQHAEKFTNFHNQVSSENTNTLTPLIQNNINAAHLGHPIKNISSTNIKHLHNRNNKKKKSSDSNNNNNNNGKLVLPSHEKQQDEQNIMMKQHGDTNYVDDYISKYYVEPLEEEEMYDEDDIYDEGYCTGGEEELYTDENEHRNKRYERINPPNITIRNKEKQTIKNRGRKLTEIKEESPQRKNAQISYVKKDKFDTTNEKKDKKNIDNNKTYKHNINNSEEQNNHSNSNNNKNANQPSNNMSTNCSSNVIYDGNKKNKVFAISNKNNNEYNNNTITSGEEKFMYDYTFLNEEDGLAPPNIYKSEGISNKINSNSKMGVTYNNDDNLSNVYILMGLVFIFVFLFGCIKCIRSFWWKKKNVNSSYVQMAI